MRASAEKVWNALVDPMLIERSGAGPGLAMDEGPGTAFRLWGRDIHGRNLEEPSLVTFSLSEKAGATEVVLTHENLPHCEAESIDEGWDDCYIYPLKELAESM